MAVYVGRTVAGENVVCGSRRLHSQLRQKPYSYRTNRKQVQRLMPREGLLRPGNRRKKRTTDSDHPYRATPTWSKNW